MLLAFVGVTVLMKFFLDFSLLSMGKCPLSGCRMSRHLTLAFFLLGLIFTGHAHTTIVDRLVQWIALFVGCIPNGDNEFGDEIVSHTNLLSS